MHMHYDVCPVSPMSYIHVTPSYDLHPYVRLPRGGCDVHHIPVPAAGMSVYAPLSGGCTTAPGVYNWGVPPGRSATRDPPPGTRTTRTTRDTRTTRVLDLSHTFRTRHA